MLDLNTRVWRNGAPMKKLILLVALAAGYVLGTRAGRERYEEIVDAARRFWGDPRVQHAAEQAGGTVKEQAPVVKDRLVDAAHNVAGSVRSRGNDASTGGTSGQPLA